MSNTRDQILAHLRDYPGSSAAFAVYMTEIPLPQVVDALDTLMAEGAVTCETTPAEIPGVPASITYRLAERIGTCETCGLTDHHLIDGICPSCRARTQTIYARARLPGLVTGLRALSALPAGSFVVVPWPRKTGTT